MFRRFFPNIVLRALWGDRRRFGTIPDQDDPEWKLWEKMAYTDFYQNTQQKGIGNQVCKLAYPVIGRVDFQSKKTLEIGPGIIRHLHHMRNKPLKYTICDRSAEVLEMAQRQLIENGIAYELILLEPESGPELPIHDKSHDIVISFNSLEHLYPLDEYLHEIKRVLVNGGLLVGGIPCEGGLAWALGRLLTTRRYVHKKYGINYDKIICWEHPNFADFILDKLEVYFKRRYLKLRPFPWLPIDFNLVANFLFVKQ
jgi:SAM-dependent methyltransferase